MKKEKAAAKYAAMYANEAAQNWGRSRDEAYSKFYDKYLALVTSEDYERFDREHGKNIDLLKIDTALAVYFVSTDFGYSFEDCKSIYYGMAKPIWDKAGRLINFIERLPCGFWLFSRLLHRFNDSYGSSIEYSENRLEKDKYEYVVSKCAYIEIFEHYGLRKFCKVMCDSDIGVMGGASFLTFPRRTGGRSTRFLHGLAVRLSFRRPIKIELQRGGLHPPGKWERMLKNGSAGEEIWGTGKSMTSGEKSCAC